MRRTIRSAIILISAVATATAVAEPRILADDGLQLELTADGLSFAADVVREQFLKNDVPTALPDVRQEVWAGVTVDLSGLSMSLAADSMALEPRDGALALRADLRRLRVTVGTMKVEKRVLGRTLSMTCTNTQFRIGETGAVVFASRLGASVESRALVLTEQGTSFDIAREQYDVRGPARCSGALGLLTRPILHAALSLARPFVDDVVKRQIRALLPRIAAAINEQAHFDVTLDLASFPPLPPRVVTIEAYLHRLAIDPKGLKLVLGIGITGEDKTRRAPQRSLVGGRRLGSLGVNPVLLTEAVAAIYPNGTPWLALDDSVIPGLGDVLDVQSAAGLWPDLLQLQVDDRQLKLSARLAAVPVFGVDAATDALTVRIPAIELLFEVKLDGVWQPYYIMALDVRTSIAPTLTDGLLSLHLADGSRVRASGRWAPGYVPKDPTFEADVAEFLFSSALDYLAAQGSLIDLDFAPFEVAGHEMGLDGVKVDGPFLTVGLVLAESMALSNL